MNPVLQASAPGKLILCGEHAVVYGRPAIALPVSAVRAHAELHSAPPGSGLSVEASDLGIGWALADEGPLPALLRRTLEHLGRPAPDARIRISSAIPIASGMGSGASIATALVRVLAQAFQIDLAASEISALVFESERAFHGTPSGIDNTVVAYERAIWFQRRAEGGPLIETLRPGGSFTLVIGDTGVRSETRAAVGDLRRRWQDDPQPYEERFSAIGELVREARAALERGDAAALGPLLDANQTHLAALQLSSPELDRLIEAARAAGALGSKLSGAGWGGIMIALAADAFAAAEIAAVLKQAGARQSFVTQLEAQP